MPLNKETKLLLRIRVDTGVMSINMNSTFHTAPKLQPHNEKQCSVISEYSLWEFYPSVDIQSVYSTATENLANHNNGSSAKWTRGVMLKKKNLYIQWVYFGQPQNFSADFVYIYIYIYLNETF